MSFKRKIKSTHILTGDELTSSLIRIGVLLAGNPTSYTPNIEDVLCFGVVEALKQSDFRVLSLITDWFEVHCENVNVDRLYKLAESIDDRIVRAYFAGIGHWLSFDTRYKKLLRLDPKKRVDLFETGTDFLIHRHGGEDERFAGSALRVPRNTLRRRLDDILPPERLASRHRTYYYRLIIGPTYRADMWAYLESHPEARLKEIAESAYGSFNTARDVKKDFEQIERAKMRLKLQTA